MVDFMVELPKKQAHLTDSPGKQWWTLHVDGASRVSGFEVGLILQSPTGELMELSIPLNFFTSNNEAEYEACPSQAKFCPNVGCNQVRNQKRLSANCWTDSARMNDERMPRYLAMMEDRLKILDK